MKVNTRCFQAGIDLGTTNSSVAVMTEEGTYLFPINDHNEVLLPSCVYIGNDGMRLVGNEARSNLEVDNKENGHIEFKRGMGKNTRYPFESIGRPLTAEELSAHVLRRLREIFDESKGYSLLTSVVTIPAMFELPASNATRIAATGICEGNGGWRLENHAGFLGVELIMEPVAAALAFGVTKMQGTKDYHLVFDLGGGTFDVALLKKEEGKVRVVGNAGNNFLGGKNFDEKLFNHVVEKLNKKRDLPDFTYKKSSDYRAAANKLLRAVEKAKIELSSKQHAKDTVRIDLPNLCNDRRGKRVDVKVKISRQTYNGFIGPDIYYTIRTCQKLLRKHKLNPSNVESILLVGGPTKDVYLRKLLQDELNIPLDTSVDPMTAVSMGAAIYAADNSPDEKTQKAIREILAKTPAECEVSIHSELRTEETEEEILGTVTISPEHQSSLETITFIRKDGGWQGTFPIMKDGTFEAEIHLREHTFNTFEIIVRGKNNEPISARPGEFTIHHDKGPEIDVTVPISLGVVEEGRKTNILLSAGTMLDATKTKVFETTKTLEKGADNIIEIPIVEGNSKRADNNRMIGTVRIPGRGLTRNLPIGTKLDITFQETTDRKLTVTCYVPLLRQPFKTVIHTERSVTDHKILKNRYKILKQEVDLLESRLEHYGTDEVQRLYEDLAVRDTCSRIKELLDEVEENGNHESPDHTDRIGQIEGPMADTFNNLEDIEKAFFWSRIDNRFKELDGMRLPQSAMEQIGEWRIQFERAQADQNEDLARGIEDKHLMLWDPEQCKWNFIVMVLSQFSGKNRWLDHAIGYLNKTPQYNWPYEAISYLEARGNARTLDIAAVLDEHKGYPAKEHLAVSEHWEIESKGYPSTIRVPVHPHLYGLLLKIKGRSKVVQAMRKGAKACQDNQTEEIKTVIKEMEEHGYPWDESIVSSDDTIRTPDSPIKEE